ncbi:hypothetical protein ACLB2K_001254 [Fragaria x ananassa]
MVGVGELIAGAALGSLFGKLYNGVEKLLINKSTQFTPLLENIKSTLHSLHPLIKQIEHHNIELSLSNKEVEDFKKVIFKGVELVEKLSKVQNWYRNPSYRNQLQELDRSLKRQLEILTAEGVRDGKETLVLVRKILLSVWNMQTAFNAVHESWMVNMFVLCLASMAFMFVVVSGTASWFVFGVTGNGVWLVCKLFWTLFRIVLKLLAVMCNIAMVPLS